MNKAKRKTGQPVHMIIRQSKHFVTRLKKLKKKDSSIEIKVDKKLKLLVVDRRHPSLRLHKIDSKYDSWSINVDMDLRILFAFREYGILLVDIGNHNEVY